MDLLSLPQELLSSVLKYVPEENLTTVRKVSSVLNSIAMKYHLEHKEFNKLQIFKGGDSTQVFLQYGDNLKFVRKHGNESVLKILRCYLPKMRRLSDLWLMSYSEPDHLLITKETVELFMKNKKLKIAILIFNRCELQFDVGLLNRLLKTLAIKYFYLRSYVKEEEYFHSTDAFFDGLQLRSFTITPRSPAFPQRISLECIRQLCEQTFPKSLRLYRMAINVSELGRFLEQNLNKWSEMIEEWAFGVKSGNMEHEDVKNYLINLACLKKFRITTIYPSQFSIYDDTKNNNFYDALLTIVITY